MKSHLSKFQTNTEYDIYDNDIINKVKPNVSYVIDDNECHVGVSMLI